MSLTRKNLDKWAMFLSTKRRWWGLEPNWLLVRRLRKVRRKMDEDIRRKLKKLKEGVYEHNDAR